MTQLAKLTMDGKCSQMRNNRHILATKGLNERLLTKTTTVKEVIQRMVNERDPKGRELRMQLLSVFNKPFAKTYQDIDVEVEFNGRNVNQTALDAASASLVRLALISVSNSPEFLKEEITLSVNGNDIQILNLAAANCVAKRYWQYKANDKKHLTSKQVKFGKNTASQMDLTGQSAQSALSNSLQVSEGLNYNCIEQQWYAFRAESDGIYHGYCIDELSGDKKFNKAKTLFKFMEKVRVGQVFSQYVNW